VDTPDLVQIWKADVACTNVISHATLIPCAGRTLITLIKGLVKYNPAFTKYNPAFTKYNPAITIYNPHFVNVVCVCRYSDSLVISHSIIGHISAGES
jgi:hypothetical protein